MVEAAKEQLNKAMDFTAARQPEHDKVAADLEEVRKSLAALPIGEKNTNEGHQQETLHDLRQLLLGSMQTQQLSANAAEVLNSLELCVFAFQQTKVNAIIHRRHLGQQIPPLLVAISMKIGRHPSQKAQKKLRLFSRSPRRKVDCGIQAGV